MKFLSYIFFFFAAFCTTAQNGAWTFRQCVDYAKRNNIEIRQLRLAQKQHEIALNTSKSAWLPNLNAGINGNIDFGRSQSRDGTIKDMSATNSYFYITSSMPIFSGLRILHDKEIKKLDLKASIEGLHKAEEDLTIQILTYYMQIILNKELQNVAENQLELCRKQLKRIEKLVQTKKLAGYYLTEIEAQFANDEVTLTKAQNNVELSILALMQLLNITDIYETFDIAVPNDDATIYEEKEPKYPERIYNYAVGNKPSIREQELLLESGRKALQAAKADYSPQINLNMTLHSYYYHYNTSGYQNDAFSKQMNDNARETIELTLSIPIFNRFRVRNNVRSAHVAILNLELALENTKENLRNEIYQAYINTVTSKETYSALKKATAAAKSKLSQTEKRYEVGKATSLEYNEAKNTYFQSLSEETQAKYDLIFRQKILDFYDGKTIFFR